MTFADERKRIWCDLQEQKRVLDKELSVEYDPTHRLRNRALTAFLNLAMKISRTTLRVKYDFKGGQ